MPSKKKPTLADLRRTAEDLEKAIQAITPTKDTQHFHWTAANHLKQAQLYLERTQAQ